MFNQSHISYDNGDYRAQIATFVHEFLHAMYFHPSLFEQFPDNKDGASFIFKDSSGVWKLRGDTIMDVAKDHFNC